VVETCSAEYNITDCYYCRTAAALLTRGALSDRGRVCSLQYLMALASAVILGSESRETRDHILLSQIRDFPFRRLLRLAGSRWVSHPAFTRDLPHK
jgi:hypothetical protein